jgi:tetratricopeptide (TPR) repeat protein
MPELLVLRPIATAFALLLVIAPAFGANEKDLEDCRQGTDNDRRMAACSRLLNSRSISPQDRAIAHNNRALAWRNRGDVERAIAEYGEAIKADPQYAQAYSNRGVALVDSRQSERGMSDCEKAVELAPRAPYGYNCRGLAWRGLNDLDRAVADCSRAIDIARNYAAAYNCRAVALATKGDHDRAIADYTQAINLAPRFYFAFSNRGRAWAAKGDFDRAIADYTEAIRLNPRYRSAYINRGNAWSKKGDDARAAKDYAEAANLNPKGAPVSPIARDPNSPPDAPQVAAAPPPARPVPTEASRVLPMPATSGRRVALVIGNSAYRAVSALPNPERDASSIANALRNLGFATVITKNNASRAEIITALKSFEDQVDKADWAVVYYAGHGIEINGVNYLVPVDARLKDDRDVQDEAVALERVLLSVENAKKLRLVILDACRDNPFVAQMKKSTSTRSISRGLGSVEPEGGVMVAYAAKHGQLAMDGEGTNSPFATALMNRLPTPNLEISLLFRMVRDDVLNATGKRQEPFVYGSLPGESLFFVQR